MSVKAQTVVGIAVFCGAAFALCATADPPHTPNLANEHPLNSAKLVPAADKSFLYGTVSLSASRCGALRNCLKTCSGLTVSAGHMAEPSPLHAGLNLPEFVADFSTQAFGNILTGKCSYSLGVGSGKAFMIQVDAHSDCPQAACLKPGCKDPGSFTLTGNQQEDFLVYFECPE